MWAPKVTLTLALCIFLSGCATIIEGDQARIRLHCSDWEKIKVIVDGRETTVTDGAIVLDKRQPAHFISLQRDGYYPSTFFFKREVEPEWFGKNFVWVAFPVAYLVDYATASHYRFVPAELHVVMRPVEARDGE